MRNFEGTVRVRIHPSKGVMLDRGVAGSTLTAADAERIMALAREAGAKHKVWFDRWSFYIPTVNEKLAENENLSLKDIDDALKAGKTPRVKSHKKYAKPVLVLADDQAPTVRKSKIIDIA
jgi:hypothetical protein